MKTRTILLLLAGVFFVPISIAQATCSQSNGTSRWRIYSSAVDSGNIYWVKGTINVSSTGAIHSGQKFTDPYGNYRTLKSGKIKVSSNCQTSGSISFTDGYKVIIKEGWMIMDKSYINGVWSDIYGNNGTFTATKY